MLTWSTNSSHEGNAMGSDEHNYLVAQVVWYHQPDPDAPHRAIGRYWAAFLSGNRVPGEFGTADEAKAAAEAHWRRRPYPQHGTGNDPDDEWLSTEEAGRRLGIGIIALTRLLDAGVLDADGREG
jgi:hypothetical protein